jgi:hypothetical protein
MEPVFSKWSGYVIKLCLSKIFFQSARKNLIDFNVTEWSFVILDSAQCWKYIWFKH